MNQFDKDLLVIDFETSGLDANTAFPLEIGLVSLDKETLQDKFTFSTLINIKNFVYTDGADTIHSIKEKDLDICPTPFFISRHLVENIKISDYILCGWNIDFDIRFLIRLLELGHITNISNIIDRHKFDVWTFAATLCRIGLLKNSTISSLSNLCKHFEIERSNMHSALEDAKITSKILRNLFLILNDK